MSGSDPAQVDTRGFEAEGSWLDGWPAMLLSLIIIGAAVYSFSPRPPPAFPATQVEVDQLLVTDLARLGQRIVAVGEQGKILYADDPGGPWTLASLDRNRGSTLTEVLFLNDQVLVAVGHDSWILRSSDAGKSWTEVLFDAEKAEPLLGLAGPFDGELMAYGAFGQWQVSQDQGKTWSRRQLVKNAADSPDEAAADPFSDPFADPFASTGDDYDPFAAFGSGGGFDDFSSRHLNAMTQASDGSLWLAGERGLVARSDNAGESWTQFETGYSGSFYGVFETQGGRIMAHGMRGNIYSSRDGGESWQRSQTEVSESMYGGRVLDDGTILLAGSSNVILRSRDNGRSFQQVSVKNSRTLTDILPVAPDVWLTAGESGVRLQGPGVPVAAEKGRTK